MKKTLTLAIVLILILSLLFGCNDGLKPDKMDIKTYEVEDYTHCIPFEMLEYQENIYQISSGHYPNFIITPDGRHVVLVFYDNNRSELSIDIYEFGVDASEHKPITHNSIDRSELLDEMNMHGDWVLCYIREHISDENSIVRSCFYEHFRLYQSIKY